MSFDIIRHVSLPCSNYPVQFITCKQGSWIICFRLLLLMLLIDKRLAEAVA